MTMPIYKSCTIQFKDSCNTEDVLISIGTPNPWDDEDIFFTCDSIEDLNSLENPNNGEDFYIISIND